MDSNEDCWKFEIFPPQGIGFAHGKKFREECRGTFVPHTDSILLLIKPLFLFPHEGKGKHTEPDASLCDVIDDDGVAQLQEVLQVSTCILAWQTIELVCLYHQDQVSPELKVSRACVNSRSNEHVGNSGGGVVVE